MRYIYTSIFAFEMSRYLNLQLEAGRRIANIQTLLRCLDKYLVKNDLTQKTLDSEVISSWINTRNVSLSSKVKSISIMNGFVKYLVSLGFEANCPEAPKSRSEYVPYIFSDAEFGRIISAADNLNVGKRLTRAALIFPILLRLLYGCGLRLGEGRSIQWKDIDLENGVLTIKKAKNLKQRLVPMDDSITKLLKNYRTMTCIDGICDDYLFESDRTPGEPFRNNSFYEWFRKALEAADIHYVKHNRRERGPCPHCLRHYFTLKSFLKSESEGRRFEETSPFLAAYLGHNSPRETEMYLSSNHSVYRRSHKRVDAALGHLFPEVRFDED